MIARQLFAVVLVAAVSLDTLASPGAVAAPLPLASAMSVHYSLAVNVDDQHQVVDTQETVEATNLTDATLGSLVFEVIPRHFSGFQMGTVTVDGTRVQPTFDDVVMEIPLRSPLASNATARLTMAFKETVPSIGTPSYEFGDGILALGHWFPELTSYQAGSWDRQRFSDVGNPFLVEAADYQVTVKTDPHVVIASTGVVTKHQGGEWTLAANGVRGFALALSRQYQSRSASVDGTRITTYFLPGDAAEGEAVLNDTRLSFDWLTRHLGPYGYPTLALAETPGLTATTSGDEFPNLGFLAVARARQPATARDSLTYLVADETARQWCASVVASDGAGQPWLTEGLATQLGFLFLKDHDSNAYSAGWARLQTDDAQAVATWGTKPLDTPAADYPDSDQYTGLLVPRAAIFLEQLRETMGTDAYFTFLRDFVATYRGGIATTHDFLTLAERYAGHDLGDLYKGYFRPASYRERGTTVTPITVSSVVAPASATPAPVSSPVPTPPPASTPVVATPEAVQQPTIVPTIPATVVATPGATASSGGPGSTFGLVVISSLVGLGVVGALSYLLIQRQS
ncbi:MAG: M1 family aminopeptidase [Chloroflexota bacterium]